MHPLTFAACVVAAAFIGSAVARADSATTMPIDEPTVIDGINLACTGVGDEARSDPRWPGFAVRIEFANAAAQYLSNVDVSVADESGKTLFQVNCDSAWILADLLPGKYTVSGTFEGITKTAKVTAPTSGQTRVVVRFPGVPGDQ